MPLALSFMVALLFARGGAGANLVIGAVAARLVAGRGIEAPRPDAGRSRLDGAAGLREILLRGRMAPREAQLEEAELDSRGPAGRHLLLREGVHLELEVLARSFVLCLLLGDIARFVVDHDGALGRVVDSVEAAAHPRGPQGEAELALDVGRFLPGGLLYMVEARQRFDARVLALLLVLAREEALVPPRVVEGEQEVVERGKVAHGAPPQVELHRLVERAAVNHAVMLPQRDPLDVDVLVLERAGLVVVQLIVADRQLLLWRDHREACSLRHGRRRIVLELFDGPRPEGSRRILGQIECLQDELARLPLLPPAHVLGARQIKRFLGPRHPHVEEPPLLLEGGITSGERVLWW